MKQYARLRVADYFDKGDGVAVFLPFSSNIESKNFPTSAEAFDYIGAMHWNIVYVNVAYRDVDVFYLQRDLVGAE